MNIQNTEELGLKALKTTNLKMRNRQKASLKMTKGTVNLRTQRPVLTNLRIVILISLNQRIVMTMMNPKVIVARKIRNLMTVMAMMKTTIR